MVKFSNAAVNKQFGGPIRQRRFQSWRADVRRVSNDAGVGSESCKGRALPGERQVKTSAHECCMHSCIVSRGTVTAELVFR